jgi:hypothetical protein
MTLPKSRLLVVITTNAKQDRANVEFVVPKFPLELHVLLRAIVQVVCAACQQASLALQLAAMACVWILCLTGLPCHASRGRSKVLTTTTPSAKPRTAFVGCVEPRLGKVRFVQPVRTVQQQQPQDQVFAVVAWQEGAYLSTVRALVCK